VKVTTEKLPESQISLQIEIDDERVQKAIESEYRRLGAKAKIPGFRPGKAPKEIIRRHFGEEAVRADAIDRLMPEVYKEALEQEDIDPVDKALYELVTDEPLVAKFTVPVKPTVDLGDYLGLRVPREAVVVEPERVQEGLESLRQRYSTLEPITRAVQWNDAVRADVTAEVGGHQFLKEDDVEFQLVKRRPVSFPGFAEGILGHAKGDEFDVEVPVPDDIQDEKLKGGTAKYHVALRETKEVVLPELNDDLARQVGEGFDSLEALRTRVESDIREALEREAEHKYHDEVIDLLAEGATLDFPPVLVDREVERLVRDQAGASTGTSKDAEQLERYLKTVGKPQEEILAEFRPIAERRVRRALVLSEVADTEHIDATDEEVDAEIEKLASGAGPQANELRKLFSQERAKDSLRRSLKTRKTLERLVEIASEGAVTKVAEVFEPRDEEADIAPAADADQVSMPDEEATDEEHYES
jgi:trigger factor